MTTKITKAASRSGCAEIDGARKNESPDFSTYRTRSGLEIHGHRSGMKTRKTRALFSTILLAVFVIVFQSHSTAADEKKLTKEYALLFGTVWNPQGRPVYGVRMKIRRADEKKVRWERISDHSGEFAIRVPPGKADYIVTADIKPGKGKARPEMTVHVENDERVDFGFHLAE